MEYNNLSIKNWALEDRPREKLAIKGTSSLSNAELLAILIGSGNKKETAVELSKRILFAHENNLNELGKSSIEQLIRDYSGIGEAKAVTIVAALELGKRRQLHDAKLKPKISSSQDVFEFFHPSLGDLPYEEFWVLLLNRANKIIGSQKISQGGLSGTVIDVRLIMKNALDQLACSMILCHNHPSGNTRPSESDISITKKIKAAGKTMDIQVLDHIIVTDQAFFSFADEGVMND
ncbi:DNA repair protein RadC [bacterium]|nr:DNA repair protein RadC [bacterium]